MPVELVIAETMLLTETGAFLFTLISAFAAIFEVAEEYSHPDAETLIARWKENDRISDRAIERELGVPHRTFVDRMKRIRAELKRFVRNRICAGGRI